MIVTLHGLFLFGMVRVLVEGTPLWFYQKMQVGCFSVSKQNNAHQLKQSESPHGTSFHYEPSQFGKWCARQLVICSVQKKYEFVFETEMLWWMYRHVIHCLVLLLILGWMHRHVICCFTTKNYTLQTKEYKSKSSPSNKTPKLWKTLRMSGTTFGFHVTDALEEGGVVWCRIVYR